MTKTMKSEVEIAESTLEGRLELAVADAELDTASLLNRAMRASGKTQRELAEALNVGESRVSQVLSGDGNLRIATLARYLRASGYVLRLDAVPGEPGIPELPKPRVRSRSRRGPATQDRGAARANLPVACWASPVLASEGVSTAITFHLDIGFGHEILFGERTKLDPDQIPHGVADFVAQNFLTPVKRDVPRLWDVSIDDAPIASSIDRTNYAHY